MVSAEGPSATDLPSFAVSEHMRALIGLLRPTHSPSDNFTRAAMVSHRMLVSLLGFRWTGRCWNALSRENREEFTDGVRYG